MLTTSAALMPRARAAEPGHAQLDYTVDDDAGVCWSELEFRRRVAARLGYDPFRADAPMVLRVRIEMRGRRARATVTAERGGAPLGRRELSDSRCDALSETVASTVSIAIDPIAASTGKADPAPVPEPLPAPPAAPAGDSSSTPSGEVGEVRAPSLTVASRVRGVVHLDLLVAFGRLPAVSYGGRLGGGVRVGAFSFVGEARFDSTAGPVALTSTDRVELASYGASLAPCLHASVFEGCGVATLASVQARARDVAQPKTFSNLVPSIGVRGGLLLPISTLLGFRANVELATPLVRVDYRIGGASVWMTQAVEGALAVGLAATM